MAELFDLLSDDVGGTDIINTLNTATKSPPKISTDTEKKSMLDRFDRPIPGQSMTSELGNAKYEQPPQYTELSEFNAQHWNNYQYHLPNGGCYGLPRQVK